MFKIKNAILLKKTTENLKTLF